jgi:putative RecB family exonuclease
MRISFSAYDNYTGCPLRYKFQYIDRVSVPKKVELEFGSLMHDIVEYALKKDPIIPSAEELAELYEKGFLTITFPDKLKKEQYYRVGKEMIQTFHDSLKPGLRETIATEKRFYLPLNDKHTLSGAIDRIDKLPFGAFEVIDYKTNFKPKTQEEVNRDKQLGVYRFAIEKLWPEAKDVRLSLHFLRSNMKLTTTRNQTEVRELIDEIIKTADNIGKETEWLPKKNPLCDWCDFQHLCPLMKQKIASSKQLTATSDIDTIVEQYLEAYQKINELEPQIHSHFDKEKIEAFHHKNGVVSRSKTGKFTIRKS